MPGMANDGPPGEDRPRARLVANHSMVSPDTLVHMSWRITDTGFAMTLDVGVPAVLQNAAPPFVDELLQRAGLSRTEVAGWAIHPGGRRILDVLKSSLELTDADLASSYQVLRQYGNMSSSTILFVLEEELRRTDRPPGPVVCLAFGPGLTIEGAVLERLA
jgi:predicted naringenin-chalcone synthase